MRQGTSRSRRLLRRWGDEMRIEREGPVALLRMENGKANAISAGLLERLDGLLGELGDARAAGITGQGSAFCAGLDLPALAELGRAAVRAVIRRVEGGVVGGVGPPPPP